MLFSLFLFVYYKDFSIYKIKRLWICNIYDSLNIRYNNLLYSDKYNNIFNEYLMNHGHYFLIRN